VLGVARAVDERRVAVVELLEQLDHRDTTLVNGARDTEHNGAIVLRDYILAHHRRRLAR
jgi:uncharacterized protein YeaO (DUF488 family)